MLCRCAFVTQLALYIKKTDHSVSLRQFRGSVVRTHLEDSTFYQEDLDHLGSWRNRSRHYSSKVESSSCLQSQIWLCFDVFVHSSLMQNNTQDALAEAIDELVRTAYQVEQTQGERI